MTRTVSIFVAAMALLLAGGIVWARTTVDFGRITGARLVTERSRNAQTRGAILGGMFGALAASGGSGGTQAAGAMGGVLAGKRLGRMAGTRQSFEYTILINDRQSIRM